MSAEVGNLSLRGLSWEGLETPVVGSDLLTKFLELRGVSRAELDLSLPEALKLAQTQPGVSQGARLIADAIANRRSVAIFGDYDVDGMTSTTIWLMVCRAFGVQAAWKIPKRAEGYGLSVAAIDWALEQRADLLICVDSGTDRVKEIEHARAGGLSTVVIDHHLPKVDEGDGVSRPDALINGHFADDPTMARLCAAGQSFVVATTVVQALVKAGLQCAEREVLWRSLVQFGAIGTVADMMDISPGFNRALVSAGLKMMRSGPIEPVAEIIAQMFGVDGHKTADVATISFGFGPAVNASGRYSQPEVAIGLFTSRDRAEMGRFASTLISLNTQRKEMQAAMLKEAVDGADRTAPIASYVGQAWEKGLVGLVASGLLEALNRPALAATLIDGKIHGSGRSVPGFDLGSAVIAAHAAGIIASGGGHAAACGFQCDPDRWAEFVTFIGHRMNETSDIPANKVDFVVAPSVINVGEISALALLAPFGQGWPKPLIGVPCTLATASVVGKNRDTVIANAGFRAIGFKAAHNGLIRLSEHQGADTVIIGYPEISEYRGSVTAEMRIRDVVIK